MSKVEIKDIFKIKSVSSPAVIPNGGGVTYSVTYLDEKSNDYVTNLFMFDGKENRQISYKKERISNVVHSPAGGRSLFIAKGEHDKPQIFLISLSGGEREQLTREKEGVNSALFSKDGRKIYYHVSSEPQAENEKDESEEQEDKEKFPEPVVIDRMKYKADSVGLLKEKYQSVKSVDLETKEEATLFSGEENYTLHAGTGGDTVIFSSDESEDRDFNFSQKLFIKEGSRNSEEIVKDEGYVIKTDISPDGRYMLMTHLGREFENATHAEVILHDLENETSVSLTKGLDKPVGDYVAADAQQSVEMNPTVWISNTEFLFLVSEYGSVNLYTGNVNGETAPLLQDAHHIYGMDAGEDYAYLTISKPDNPGELYQFDLKDRRLKRVTEINSEYVGETDLVVPEAVEYKSFDDTTVHGWFMKPAGFEEGARYPMITNIHGGPHAFYANTYFHEMQVLAAKGYAVLYVNPRGSHSYSQDFVDAVRGDYGNGDYKDIMEGVDHVTDMYDWIDTENLGVTGGSYGGFMTNWIIGHTDRFKAAVTQRSISNWVSFRGVSDIGYYFSDWQIKADFNDIDTMWHHSPIKYADKMETPLLILHSEHDYRCPVEQAEQLFIALKYRKKETRFVRFPAADHNLSRTGKPSLRVQRLEHLTSWFDEHLDHKVR